MTTAVFGDFLDQGGQHLQAAARSHSTAIDLAPASPQILQLITVLARYLEDRTPAYAAGVPAATTTLQPWEHTVVDLCTALRQATSSLTQGLAAAGISSQEPGGDLARHLEAAAISLTAGRDLLHTHLTTSPSDLLEYRSEWAPVVTSLPVTRAVIAAVASWCQPLAVIADQLSSAGRTAAPGLAELRPGLRAAAHWLQVASTVVPPAHTADLTSGHDLRLLRAIPAALSPARRPPQSGESVLELCLGATVRAQRLRTRVFGAVERARWTAPAADTWRWAATAAAATGHASDLILRSLASDASHLGNPPHLDGTQLQLAADAVAASWQAWRQVAASWADLTTERRGQTAPATIELSDLVLRIGRLAWDDPQWTPARGGSAGRRGWEGSTTGDLVAVVAAIHQASDALTQVAAADQQAVAAADRGGRLYVRTRSLPPQYNIPRPYATAPTDRTAPLLNAYRATLRASSHAASELAALALATDAPSTPLALARAAAAPQPAQATSTGQQPTTTQTSGNGPAGVITKPGPTELAIRHLRVQAPGILLRAVAIDEAGRQLIAQATHLAPPPRQRHTKATPQPHPASGAAQLAAQDLPVTPKTQKAIPPGNRTPPAPSTSEDLQRPPLGNGHNTTSRRAR
ncbi:MAG: hypothetical protein ACRDNF_04190 [Streptosporangiaceae bacterium]